VEFKKKFINFCVKSFELINSIVHVCNFQKLLSELHVKVLLIVTVSLHFWDCKLIISFFSEILILSQLQDKIIASITHNDIILYYNWSMLLKIQNCECFRFFSLFLICKCLKMFQHNVLHKTSVISCYKIKTRQSHRLSYIPPTPVESGGPSFTQNIML